MVPVRRGLLTATALLAALAFACSGGSDSKGSAGTTARSTSAAAGSASQAASSAGQLALVRDQRLLVRDAKGDERQIVRSPANTFPTYPMWSPDGKRIAYVQAIVFTGQANADWGGDIYVVDAAGGDPKLVLKHDQPGAQMQGLAWTPDGGSLLYGYQLTLIKDGKYQGQVLRIDRLEIASGKHTQVIDDAMLPSLSNDGARLSFMKQDSTGKGGLFVSAADGSGAKTVLELGPKFLAILGPRISPDGSTIAFAAVASQATEPGRGGGTGLRAAFRRLLPRTAEAHGLPMDVWKVTVADGAVARLTSLNEDEPYPTWSRDGATVIVFATGGLYETKADGSNVKRIGQGAFGGQADAR
jgi:Tol biopolymer transport system component